MSVIQKKGVCNSKIPVPESLLQKMKDGANNVLKMNPNKSPEGLLMFIWKKIILKKLREKKPFRDLFSPLFFLQSRTNHGRNIIFWGVSLF
ncbi:MAG: hypothetical protein CM1200mP13_17750 [Candidatus Pelagibacterales bacterium]|nr:MAG: hypothetical protein CM1200mP13_17750 [Pelagibacterales bacterium]